MTTTRQQRPRVSNVSSILLNPTENETVFGCLGRQCAALATGVVQLFLAEAPSRQKWMRKQCGVACFEKDNPKRSYFIRLYDMTKRQLLWEQELYQQFVYSTPREYFHTFEADNCRAALNFASEDEAAKFKKAVEGKLIERQKKRLERKQHRKQQTTGAVSPTPPKSAAPAPVKVGSGPTPASLSVGRPAATATLPTSSKNKEKGNKRKKLTKEDISTPTDFRHISHVGWDPNTGLDMKKLDPEMKSLFETIGIDEQSGVDEETIDFIYDFVDQHGGLEAVKKDLAKRAPPAPAPTHSAPGHKPGFTPPPPPTRQTGGAPPPPARTGLPAPPRPGRSGMALPPPPPPSDRSPAPVRQAMAPPPPPSGNRSAAPPPPPISNAPAPPPPPPPPAAPMAPPPPPMVGGSSVAGSGPPVGRGPPIPTVDSGRGALLDQIHRGSTLKSVETNTRNSGGDTRSGLLDQIRSGTSLKPVDHSHDDTAPATDSQGIVGALAQALAMRKNVIQGSDDDADSDDDIGDDDSDEWTD